MSVTLPSGGMFTCSLYAWTPSSGVSVTNSHVSDLGSGIGHYNDNGLTISNNTLSNLEADGIFGGGSSHVVVTGNQISDFHPAVGDHPDAIQFWGSAAGAPPPTDITIADNVITRGAGDVMQGIFIENSQNLTITGNAMAGTMYNGISLSNSTNTLIQNNFVQGDVDMSSWIIARNGSVNVTVTGNTVSSTIISTSDNVNYVQGPNTTIPAAMRIAPANVAAARTLTAFDFTHVSFAVTLDSFMTCLLYCFLLLTTVK